MKHIPASSRRLAVITACAAGLLCMAGCEIDSFFDPSKTGRFMPEPTMIPILDRIDVVEPDISPWGETTGVMPQDLLPNDLTYVLAPGDFVTVEVFEGLAVEQWRVYSRRIDAAGNFRIPEIGDVRAAGRTVQEFEDHLAELMAALVVTPRVHVHVEEGVAFTYTIHGNLFNPGLFTLRKADLRLNEALAAVGGVPPNTERIFISRRVRLAEELLPEYERPDPTRAPDAPRVPPPDRPRAPVDVEDLIEQLEEPRRPGARDRGHLPGQQDAALAALSPSAGRLAPGLIDIDDLDPVRVSERQVRPDEVRELVPPRIDPPEDETYIYIEERGEWVRVRTPSPEERPRVRARDERHAGRPAGHAAPYFNDEPRRPGVPGVQPRFPDDNDVNDEPRLVTERIIEIPYDRLLVDSRYDIVVRPGDRIYVEGPRLGLVYVSGEVARPGVYDLPQVGRITLSRLIAAAGDLGPIAQPERVDITRMIGSDREATIRLNLAAIRRRTEPDIFIKPNDHIIIGTSWIATPLAVIRNGFRVTYGFGFLLDRNFGNDVFGAPPGTRLVQ